MQGRRRRASPPAPRIDQQLDRSFRAITVGIVVSVVVGALVATLVLAVVRPRVRSSTELSRALRTLHE
nr:hypothetical protein [Acidimicrobiia bacterium]